VFSFYVEVSVLSGNRSDTEEFSGPLRFRYSIIRKFAVLFYQFLLKFGRRITKGAREYFKIKFSVICILKILPVTYRNITL